MCGYHSRDGVSIDKGQSKKVQVKLKVDLGQNGAIEKGKSGMGVWRKDRGRVARGRNLL